MTKPTTPDTVRNLSHRANPRPRGPQPPSRLLPAAVVMVRLPPTSDGQAAVTAPSRPTSTPSTPSTMNSHLVEGAEAVVESPTDAFDPFVVHYAETFIIPAEVGAYTVRPHGPAAGGEIGVVTASVRGTERPR